MKTFWLKSYPLSCGYSNWPSEIRPTKKPCCLSTWKKDLVSIIILFLILQIWTFYFPTFEKTDCTLFALSVVGRSVSPLIFFNNRHKSPILTQYHLIPFCTKLYWPSIIKYQPVLTHTDPVPPNTSQYRPILTQYHHISMSLATRSLATMSLTTIVPRDKFYNRLKHKKPRTIIQIRDLHCLLGLVLHIIWSVVKSGLLGIFVKARVSERWDGQRTSLS